MDTEKEKTGWSDAELEASVDAYLKMLALEISGQPIKKSVENRLLREGPLHKRSASSVEYRMQNISAVFEQLKLRRITGYMPAKNIGAGVSERIRNVLATKVIHDVDNYTPTSDEETLNRRAAKIQKQKYNEEPIGELNPQQTSSSGTLFVRDPAVRAWVRDAANGSCEGCGEAAPFEKDGLPFLEVHHVKHLAQKGSDRTSNAVALCPNCHRRCHHSSDRDEFTLSLYKKVTRLVAED